MPAAGAAPGHDREPCLSRNATIALLGLAAFAAVAAALLLRSDDDAGELGRGTDASVEPAGPQNPPSPAAPRATEGATPSGEAIEFADLPSEHRPDTIRARMEGADAWLDDAFPGVRGAYVGVDCSAPPCLLGLRFEPGDLGEPGADGKIAISWREELTERLGWQPWGVLTVDDAGVQHVWMYGLPDSLETPEGAADKALMVSSAAERFETRMARIGVEAGPE
jgi:hypothetical protein